MSIFAGGWGAGLGLPIRPFDFVYATAVVAKYSVNTELADISQMPVFGSREGVAGAGLDAFRTLLRRKESLLHFAESGMRIGEPSAVLDAIYAEFVERTLSRSVEYARDDDSQPIAFTVDHVNAFKWVPNALQIVLDRERYFQPHAIA